MGAVVKAPMGGAHGRRWVNGRRVNGRHRQRRWRPAPSLSAAPGSEERAVAGSTRVARATRVARERALSSPEDGGNALPGHPDHSAAGQRVPHSFSHQGGIGWRNTCLHPVAYLRTTTERPLCGQHRSRRSTTQTGSHRAVQRLVSLGIYAVQVVCKARSPPMRSGAVRGTNGHPGVEFSLDVSHTPTHQCRLHPKTAASYVVVAASSLGSRLCCERPRRLMRQRVAFL